MKTINIKGKEYVQVNERLREFRSNPKYEGYSLTSELVSNDNGLVIMKATISDKQGKVVATGFAHEDQKWSDINSTSHIENCETSAWGRALGNLGIGILDSVATAEDVSTAINRQQAMANRPAMPQQTAVRRVAVAPQPMSPNQQTMAAINSSEAYPKLGEESEIDGVFCVVKKNRNTGELFWAAKDPNVKFTRHIGPEK